jgi:hypothetical protein
MSLINIKFSNKVFYTLIAMIVVVLIGIGVIAYGTSDPAVFGHSAGEIEGTVPSGFCIFSDSQSSCPSGWTIDSSFNGRTIQGVASSPGSDGGDATHLHTTGSHVLTKGEIPPHTHRTGQTRDRSSGYAGSLMFSNLGTDWPTDDGSLGGLAGNAHDHGNTGSKSSWPPYRTVVVCCKN